MKNENYRQMYEFVLKGEGKILGAYSRFYQYSFANQMYAMFQMMARGIEISPLATFKKWQSLGRAVRKGEKAIEMCVPRTWTKEENGEEKEGLYFVFLRKWFAMSQTDGEAVEFPEVAFDFDLALKNLGITKVPFERLDGNCQGYASKRDGKPVIAINPMADLPDKTFFHEVAHCLLHLEGDAEFIDSKTTGSLKEVEADSVALCCSIALGLEKNIPYAVGYIHHWRKDNEVPVESIKKIFRATDKILKAGKVGGEEAK